MGSQKKLAVLALVLGLSLTAHAADPYTAKFQPGKWTGTVVKSVSPDLQGKKFTATTDVKGDVVNINVVMDGAKGQEKEIWQITGNELTQTEYDAMGKVVGTPYKATAQAGSTDMKKTFAIHCTDKATNKCDNGIDANNNWVITVENNKLTYAVYGKLDSKNPQSAIGERHVFEFKLAGK